MKEPWVPVCENAMHRGTDSWLQGVADFRNAESGVPKPIKTECFVPVMEKVSRAQDVSGDEKKTSALPKEFRAKKVGTAGSGWHTIEG